MASTGNAGATRPHIFIQTNNKQSIGAIVSAYSMTRSPHADKFDVTIMNKDNYPWFAQRDGQTYKRHGVDRVWLENDLQSFTLTRFLPPQLMGYQGRALVVDPDVFAVQDVWELLTRDMHWDVEKSFNELFEGKRDYHNWISLLMEDPNTIGVFENEWNDFDKLTPKTKMIHNTRRRTQPWKTGLKVDYTPTEFVPVIGWIMRMRRKMFGEHALLGRYAKHPDPKQEQLFYGLLKGAYEAGMVTDAQIKEAMEKNYIRHDSVEVMKAAPTLPPLTELKAAA